MTIKELEHSVSWSEENRRHVVTVPWVNNSAVTPGDVRGRLISGRRRCGHVHLVIQRPAEEKPHHVKAVAAKTLLNYKAGSLFLSL